MTVQRDVAVRYALEYSDKGLARAVQTTRQLEQTSQRTGQAVTAASRRMSDEWKLLDRQARQFDTDTTRRALSQGSAVSASVERQVVSMRKLGASYREIAATQRTAGTSAAETASAIERASAREIAAYKRVEAARGSLKRTLAKAVGVGGMGSGEGRSFVRGTVRGAVGHGSAFLGGGLLGGVAGLVSTEGIKRSIEGTTQLVKQAEILAHYTGMSAQTAMQFQGVANALGVSSKSLGMGFRTLSTAMNTAITKPTQASTQAFRQLGISQADVKAHSKDLGGMFGVIADRLNAIPPGAERTALAAKLLGRNWQGLAPLLMQGSKGMEEQLKQAKALGITLGGDPLKNIGRLHEAEINLKLAQEGLSVQFTEHVAPALIKVTMAGIKLAGNIRRDLTPAFTFLSPIVKDVGHWLSEHKTIVEALVIAFAGLKIVRVVGGWVGGLVSDFKAATKFGREVIGMLTGQTAAAERAAIAQKELGAATVTTTEEEAAQGRGLGVLKGIGGLALGVAGVAGAINAATGKGGQGGVAGVGQRFFSGASFGLLKAPTGPQAQIQKQIETATAQQLPALRALVKKTQDLGGLTGRQADLERQLIDARGRQLRAIGHSEAPGTMRLLSSDQGSSRFSTVGAQLRAITPKLADLGKVGQQYQNAGALAALKFALGLEQNGRLPKGATDKLIRDLEGKFPALAKFMGRAGITSVTALSDALDVRRIETSSKKLIDSFHHTFAQLPKFAQTAGDSTQQKMRTAENALRRIVATGTAQQRAAAQPMLKKLVADYGAYMAAIKQKTADAEKEARASIEQLGGDWQNLGSVVQTVVNQMILPSAQAAGGAITSILGLSGQLAQVTHSLRGHQAMSVPTGVRLTHGAPRGAHHAAAPRQHGGWSIGGGGGARATMRYYHHHPIGRMTEAQYQAYLAAHAPGPSTRHPSSATSTATSSAPVVHVFHVPAAQLRLQDRAATQQRTLALAQTRLDDRMTRRGIDQSSAQGAKLLEAFDIHSVHVLQRTVKELRHAYEIAKKTGNRQDIMSAGSKLQQALGQLDQAVTDKIVQKRNRIEAVAQALVDKATHRETLATTGEQALQLRQQLAGTYGTVGGAQQLSAFVKSQLVPALTGELTALGKQEKAAKKAGDKALAASIAEAIAGKQNDILQAQLDAQNAIKDAAQQTAQNTASSAGGDLGVSYQGQAMGDLAGLFNGV